MGKSRVAIEIVWAAGGGNGGDSSMSWYYQVTESLPTSIGSDDEARRHDVDKACMM
jgi:hypothetical protein